MTAPAVEDGADVATWAWGILDRAERLDWPAGGYDAIADAAQDLKDLLELSDAMTGLGWDESPSLAGCTQGVAEDIAVQASALVTVIRKHCGDEAADYVRGREGESWH